MGTNLGGVVQDAIPDDRRLQVLRRRWSPRALLALPAHSVAMKNPRFCGGPGIQYYEEHRIGKYARRTHRTSEQQVETAQSQEAHDLQIIITYLYDTLDARQKGTETAEGALPPAVRKATRSDMTTLRADASTGRLNPTLSVELCREYVAESRLIPELALRFGTSVDVVRKTLRGQSWAPHTEGHLPNSLRLEPPRLRPRGPSHSTFL